MKLKTSELLKCFAFASLISVEGAPIFAQVTIIPNDQIPLLILKPAETWARILEGNNDQAARLKSFPIRSLVNALNQRITSQAHQQILERNFQLESVVVRSSIEGVTYDRFLVSVSLEMTYEREGSRATDLTVIYRMNRALRGLYRLRARCQRGADRVVKDIDDGLESMIK